jgi:hypothetical protein
MEAFYVNNTSQKYGHFLKNLQNILPRIFPSVDIFLLPEAATFLRTKFLPSGKTDILAGS